MKSMKNLDVLQDKLRVINNEIAGIKNPNRKTRKGRIAYNRRTTLYEKRKRLLRRINIFVTTGLAFYDTSKPPKTLHATMTPLRSSSEDAAHWRRVTSMTPTTGSTFRNRFAFGDRVIIDDDDSLVVRVSAFQYRNEKSIVEVGYVHNGDAKVAWIEEWRLSAAPD